jgi:hypothetical protein
VDLPDNPSVHLSVSAGLPGGHLRSLLLLRERSHPNGVMQATIEVLTIQM